MEEMLLRVCVVVASLLYIKDHTVVQEQEKNVIMNMQEREYLLQTEAAKLEQEAHRVATGLPHSNQEVSQSRHESTYGEGENPQVLAREGLDVLDQNQLIKDIQDEPVVVSPQQHGIVVDKNNPLENFQEDDMSGHRKEDAHQDQEMKTLNEDHIKEDNRADQVGGTLNQMPSEDNPQNVEYLTEENPTASSKPSTEQNYNWYLWKFLSLISLFRLFRKFLSKGSESPGTINPIKDKTTSRSTGILSQILIPDHQVLSSFYDQRVRIPPDTSSRVCEFVEGFADELLEAVRDTCNYETDMQIGDFIGIGSLYELWATGKTMVCDLYVPITAPRSHGFDVELWKKKDASLLGFGRIKVVKAENTLNGCPCMDGNADDEDMLCLLHPHNEPTRVMVNAIGGPLCQENTPYLSKKLVIRWFRLMINKAWGEISHKYEFELGFRSKTAPGALRVRFRSGQIILFNITPVVQVKASEVYLVSYLPTDQNSPDIHWPISFASYENALLQYFSKTLPYNSCHIECLQILSFLHKQQISLTGKCGLTSHHLKSTLLHLLMDKPTEWKHEQLSDRLADMLVFLEQRLRVKDFHHALVGNALVPRDIELPKEFQIAKPTNIFLPMALDEECYLKTVQHVQELVKNAPVFIQEYSSVKSSGLERK